MDRGIDFDTFVICTKVFKIVCIYVLGSNEGCLLLQEVGYCTEIIKAHEIIVQSNLVIRNLLVPLKLFLNTKCSLSLWSKLTIGHGKWFLKTNFFPIKMFLATKFDCMYSGGFTKYQVTVACGLKFHWYLKTLSLKFQKDRTTKRHQSLYVSMQ